MSIHQTIHDTLHLPPEEVMELIGASDPDGVARRQELMRLFLKNQEWGVEAYKNWLRERQSLPGTVQMAKNVLTAGKQAIQTRLKTVSTKEYDRRIAICQRCDYYINEKDRCAECGCWVKVKATLEGWNCRVGKW